MGNNYWHINFNNYDTCMCVSLTILLPFNCNNSKVYNTILVDYIYYISTKCMQLSNCNSIFFKFSYTWKKQYILSSHRGHDLDLHSLLYFLNFNCSHTISYGKSVMFPKKCMFEFCVCLKRTFFLFTSLFHSINSLQGQQ